MAEGWKSPATMIALAGLVLSVAAFSTGRFDQGRLAKLEENKLQLEQLRTDLDTEIRKNSEDREARRAAISEQRRKELQSELSEVQRNIAIAKIWLQSNWNCTILKLSWPILLILASTIEPTPHVERSTYRRQD